MKCTMPDCKKSTALTAHRDILLAWDDGSSDGAGFLVPAKTVYRAPLPFVPAPSVSPHQLSDSRASPVSSLASGSSRAARALFSQDSEVSSFGSQYITVSEGHSDWASAPPSWSADPLLGKVIDPVDDSDLEDEHMSNTTFLAPSPPPVRPSQGSEASVHAPASISDLPLAPPLPVASAALVTSATSVASSSVDCSAGEAALLEVVADLRL